MILYWTIDSCQKVGKLKNDNEKSRVYGLLIFFNLCEYLMGSEKHHGYGLQAKPEMGFSNHLSYPYQFTA